MKQTTLILAILIGQTVSGYGVDLVNTNIVGSANTGSTELYAVEVAGTSYYITNSSITSANGPTRSLTTVPSGNNQFALGTGGIISSGATHDLLIEGTSIDGSNGGSITTLGGALAGNKVLTLTGGNGISAANTVLGISGTSISGGNGGIINVSAANNTSSANGGYGILFTGVNSMTATDSSISGGKGGNVKNEGNGRTGIANGAAGIYINGGSTVVDLNLTNTTVTGGDGGSVSTQVGTSGAATGGDGLLITGGATVTVNGGIYEGGKGGKVAGVQQAGGSAIVIQGSTVTLAGGTFLSDIILSGTSSTLSLKDTYSDDAAFVQKSSSASQVVTINEWYDGQLQDVTVSQGIMRFNFNGTNAFNLDGIFKIAGSSATTAKAEFNSGLVVKAGGVLDLGTSSVLGSDVTTEADGTVLATRSGTTLGKIQSTGNLLLESGTKWIINDIGSSTFNVGQIFTLATGTSISNGLDYTDVVYVGKNGSAGWLGLITNVYNTASAVNAVYGQMDINEVLGVVGDTSDFGLAMEDLTALVPQTNTNVYKALGSVTPFLDEARGIMSNGYVRTPEVARAIIGLQSIFADQIKDRTRSNLNQMEVGYPSASSPMGASGWSWLRGLSDRWESGAGSDRLRGIADRAEDSVGYNQVRNKMNSASADLPLEDIGLPPEWQVWGRGYGSKVEQDSRDGFAGYDADIGGGVLGIDKRMNNVLIGLGGGYTRTELTGYADNNAKVDTGHAVVYLAAHGDNAFFDVNLNGALSSVDTEFQSLGYSASYDATSVGFYVGGGYALALTDFMVLTPDASLLTTYYSHDSYNESSSLGLPTKMYDSYDQVSPVSTVGATLSFIQKIDLSRSEMAMQPEIRGHWLHDFNAELDDDSYALDGGSYSINVPLMATEEDLYRIGAGIRLSQWESTASEIGVDVDYTFGDDYEAYIISGKLMHRF